MYKFVSGATVGLVLGTTLGASAIVVRMLNSRTLRPYIKEAISDQVDRCIFGDRRQAPMYGPGSAQDRYRYRYPYEPTSRHSYSGYTDYRRN